jgi:hypothetical protein
MLSRMRMTRSATRATVVLALIAALAGCGSSLHGGSIANASDTDDASSLTGGGDCSATVLNTLGNVALRVYHEGVASSRTASALSLITHSLPLRRAIEEDDPRAARSAVQALIKTGHMTDLKVLKGGRTIVDVGGPALAPLHGTIAGAGGAPIASFVASVWADNGFISEVNGITEGATALRLPGHDIPGSFAIPQNAIGNEGVLTERGTAYRYTSFPAAVYPSGQLRVYVLRSVASMAGLCGHTPQDTLVNTLSHIATLIYAGEAGRRTLPQIHRVQHNRALLQAVAQRDPAATKLAIDKLLNEHIVRLRVSTGGHLLSDVGGPFVLAPVQSSLHLGGRKIGSFVLSIQDDLGYRLLAERLAGLDVLLHAGSRLIMSSLDPAPRHVPSAGPFEFRGHAYRVFTFTGKAFPSGPLTITVLIPIPYV